MKIGIISDIYCAVKEPFTSGLEKHTFMLTHGLQEYGHDVTLFTAGECDPRLPFESIASDLIQLNQIALDPSEAYFAERYVTLHGVYERLMNKLIESDFDIIHNNSPHYLPVSMAHLLPMPIVTALHAPPFGQLIQAIKTAAHLGNQHYVCLSDHHAEGWRPYLLDYSIIPNGIPLSHYQFSDMHQGYALWFGRLVPEKGAHLALEAARMAHVPIRIAGPILDQNYFDTHIRPQLSETALYLGHLDETAIISQLGGAVTTMVTPLWDEPFGLNIIESLACGTPVVGFARGALSELVTDQTGILAECENVSGLANALSRASDISRMACAHAAQKYGIQAMIDAYETLYQRLSGKDLSHRLPKLAVNE